MNIDELKQSLTTIAAEADDTANDRLAAVDRKVTQQRRNTVVGTVAAAVLVIGAVAIGSTVLGRQSDEPQPTQHGQSYLPHWRTTPIPTVDDDGVRFYASPAGATLIGHGVTQPGQDSATFTVTGDDLHLGYASECFGPATGKQPRVDFLVNGTWFSGGRCQPYEGPDPVGPSYLPGQANWRSAGVRPDKAFDVTVQIVPRDRDLPNAAHVQLAGGVYELPDKPVAGGPDRQVVSEGHTYKLREVRSGVPDANARLALSIKTASMNDDLLAVVGAHGSDKLTTASTVEGQVLAQAVGTGWVQSLNVTNDGSVDATFKVMNHLSSDTQIFLGVYERID